MVLIGFGKHGRISMSLSETIMAAHNPSTIIFSITCIIVRKTGQVMMRMKSLAGSIGEVNSYMDYR